MIYTTRYGACPSCKYKYRFGDDEDSPCFNCCHNKEDNYEKEGETDERSTEKE